MKTSFRTATRFGGALCCLALQIACHAQSAASTRDNSAFPKLPASVAQRGDALNLLASAKGEQPVDPASAAPSTASAAVPPATVVAPLTNDAVIKELAEMKARIAQLETELRSRDGAANAERDKMEKQFASQQRAIDRQNFENSFFQQLFFSNYSWHQARNCFNDGHCRQLASH